MISAEKASFITKKKQEKYKESESDFREKSSFDKVLGDEIRKGPNEDGKVL